MRSLSISAQLFSGCLLLSLASIVNATPRIAEGFRYPVGNFIPGPVTAAQDQVDDFYRALDFAAPGSGNNAEALHPGEDWQRNDTSTVEPYIRTIANGEVVARSNLHRTVLIRHYVPAGTLRNTPASSRLAGTQELYSVYRNINYVSLFSVGNSDFNSQTDPDSPPRNVRGGSLLGRIDLSFGSEMQLELRTIEPDFDALNANWPDDEDFYTDIDTLESVGLIDPSEFIDNHRTIEIERGPKMYIHQQSSDSYLHQLDVLTGKVTRLSRIGTPHDIAFSPSGELYSIWAGNLNKIDLATGNSSLIGRHGVTLERSLVFSETGELFAAGGLIGHGLFQLDLTTGAGTSLGELDYRPGALAFHQGELYMAARNDSESPTGYLVKLQLQPNLRAIEVGEFDVTGVSALASAPDGKLYGTWGTQVVEVNPDTAEITPISDFSSQGLLGATGSGFFTEAGAPQTVLASSILPSSRSVTVGSTATAFLTIINTGGITATGCGIASRLTSSDLLLEFQSTDPATNAPVGERNLPVDIPAGGLATFVIYLHSNLEWSSVETSFNVGCDNTELARSITGLNTLLYSATEEPTPDIVALAATANNDGVVALDSASGIGAFALASVNVGTTDDITVTLDTGSANKLPLQLSLCETDTVGQCISGDPSSLLTTTIDAGATPTFSVFLTTQGQIAFRPDLNRVYVRFRDSSGAIRGSTSVAVQAQ